MLNLIHQPVKPFILSQKFGQNSACVSLDGTKKVIRCDGYNPPEGYKSLYGANGHTGIDIPTKHGQEVYAAQGGTIYKIDTDAKSGLDVRIESTLNGEKYRHVYEHLLGYQCKVGDVVQVGQLIGWADNTGYSSGNHLHFQVSKLVDGKWVLIDPLSIMSTMFALDVLKKINLLKYYIELLAKLSDQLAVKLRKP